MQKFHLASPLLLAASAVSLFAANTANTFEQTVAPILKTQCSACHSETQKTSGFSVLTPEAIIAGGNKHGKAVVEGHPEQSVLIKLLKGELEPRMPIGKPLEEADVAKISEWIKQLPPPAVTSKKQDWRWPYEKPVKKDPPAVKNAGWVRNPIDSFVLAKLESAGIAPAPAADKRTLARRTYFDLVGVPPSVDEMNAFLADDTEGAYEKLVDKLLADPRYGERWGRHWLDLARYGETSGLEGDGVIGNAWRYRDWVINAFNTNMPYDRFVIQQLAGGDEHSKTRNNYQPDPQGYVPTGFLRVAPWDRSNLVAAEVRQNYLSEVTTTTASVFLGLTVGCARCHDHKYDPIPTKDFYRLQAFFNATQAGSGIEVPYKDKAFAAKAKANIERYQARLKDGPEKKELDAFEKVLLKKLIAGKAEKAKGKPFTKADLRLEMRLEKQRIFTEAEKELYTDLLEDALRTNDKEEQESLEKVEKPFLEKLIAAYTTGGVDRAGRFESLGPKEVRDEAMAKYAGNSIFSAEEKNRYAELSGQLEVFQHRLSRWKSEVLGVVNVPGPPNGPYVAPTRIMIRGDYKSPGEEVEPGFPTAITGNSEPATLETDRYRQFPTRGHRTTLAKWIASPENPLTARVMVNRIWQHHFGQGIVRTPSDFGKNGERPTHPELLDYLAVRFVESGWDIKAMQKLMLLSNTFQQAAENPATQNTDKDADNKLLSRYERRRLEAEAIRDSILFASGRLNNEMGGPSIFPPLPNDLADFARYGRTGGLMWEPNEKEEDARRRSVYIFQRRSLPLPMMASLDAIVFSESCDRRNVTTTPLQALSMMNGALVQEEAAHLATKVAREVPDGRDAQIKRLFNLVLNRAPQKDELQYISASGRSLESITRVLFNSNEFVYTE
jgi:hypothetical protein